MAQNRRAETLLVAYSNIGNVQTFGDPPGVQEWIHSPLPPTPPTVRSAVQCISQKTLIPFTFSIARENASSCHQVGGHM